MHIILQRFAFSVLSFYLFHTLVLILEDLYLINYCKWILIFDFRKIKYAHVTIDTLSVFPITTALTRKATKSIVACVDFFLKLGIPNQIKLAITAKHLRCFVNNLMLHMLLRYFIILKDKVL